MDRLKNLNLLFLEDNLEFAKNTTEMLNLYFKKVFHAEGIKEASDIFSDHRIDVIISDIKVQDGNAFDFILKVRDTDDNIPIVVLSAHKDEEFLFKAIPLNILSYELKPLRYEKLLSLLLKISAKLTSCDKVILGENLEYDYKSNKLFKNNEVVPLTKKEILLIELLIKNKNKIVSDEMIQKYVWEDNIMSEAALKNLVFRLRKKINAEFVHTVTNMGYRLSHTP